jgi:formylglycine-generating enzyme required for sulfatase activity
MYVLHVQGRLITDPVENHCFKTYSDCVSYCMYCCGVEDVPLPVPSITVTALSPERERALKPKDTFKECTNCPEMIVVPAGAFTMGSPEIELGEANERPRHTVTFGYQFAVGKFAVTFDEWDVCFNDGGCNGYRPDDHGWGRGQRPIINVSWDDAKAYVAWLSKKTGKSYRLLSEAEYEYAARAGTDTPYPWGYSIGEGNANCAGCGSHGRETAPAGSFPPNGFGLYDMVGNVDEWTEDCWHDSYTDAPADGAAWASGECTTRVVRGGSWDTTPGGLRSAYRWRYTTDTRDSDIGFRVARRLPAP